MGRNYSFDIWVPRERLFGALSVINKHDHVGVFPPVMWPDGRVVPANWQSRKHKEDPMSIDFITGDVPWVGLRFEADDALRRYNEDHMERARQHNYEGWDCRREGGVYQLPLTMWIHSEPTHWEWLEAEAEGDLVCLCLWAQTSALSDLFSASVSVQQKIVKIARLMNAHSCALDFEGPVQLLYLNGETFDLWSEEHCRPFEFALSAGRPQSDAARRAGRIRERGGEMSFHERLELMMLATRDADSGVRGKALRALWNYSSDSTDVMPAFEGALADADWRVRSLAVYLLSAFNEPETVALAPLIEPLLRDEHPQVQIAAIMGLGRLECAREKRLEVLFGTALTPANRGIVSAALSSLRHDEAVLERAAQTPNFPLVHTLARYREERARGYR